MRGPLSTMIMAVTWAGLLAACGTSTAVEEPETAAVIWHETACPENRATPPVRCGSVDVYEDREAGAGRTLAIRTVVLGSTGEEPTADPLFVLMGGPGQGAADFAFDIAPAYAATRERRDVVFVDQRGTGGSNPLDCELPGEPAAAFGAVFPRAVMAACRGELETRANLGLYTTALFVDDLDDVRQALGDEQINLSGGSYGTRASLVYARRHPAHTRSLILDGVFPVTERAALTYAETAEQSLRHIFADCAADAACAAAYPELEAAVDRMLAAWSGPVEVEITVGEDQRATVPLSRGDFGYAVRGLQYGSRAWSLPKYLWKAAAEGDFAPIAEGYYRRAVAIWEAVSVGQHHSVFCAEDLPFVAPDEVAEHTEGSYLGRYLFDEYAEVCELWVRGAIADDFHQPTHSDVPVLMFSGLRDPITPPQIADQAAETLPNTLHVVFPAGGHGYTGGDDGGCKGRIIDQFLEQGSVDDIDATCVDEIVPAGFELPGNVGD